MGKGGQYITQALYSGVNGDDQWPKRRHTHRDIQQALRLSQATFSASLALNHLSPPISTQRKAA